MTVPHEARQQVRAEPAYQRAVWGLRLALLAPVLMGLAVGGVALNVRGTGLVIMFAFPFGSMVVGLGLSWSSILPLMRVQQTVLAPCGLDRFEQAAAVRGMVLRDVFAIRAPRRSPHPEV
ncbi:hypothetical protein ACN27G_01035 [Plantactinospora sp. WMMB334]|uniref:hypothetical protein n=1 Tax=Plantactinospora sp. WMMB334 TaxID=3404119 RepID=UPI003B959A3A